MQMGMFFKQLIQSPRKIVICDVASANLFKQRRRKALNPISRTCFIDKIAKRKCKFFASFFREMKIFLFWQLGNLWSNSRLGLSKFRGSPRIKLFRVVKILS
jgi:hypothetical protein